MTYLYFYDKIKVDNTTKRKKNMPTIDQLVMIAEVDLLEIGGVDNWDWYSEAMSDYVKSDDPFEDAENYLDALQSNGIDGWDWYGESLAGLSEYEEYLKSLPSLDNALDIFGWKNMMEEVQLEDDASKPAAIIALEKKQLTGEAAEQVYSHVIATFGIERAEEIYDSAIEKGLWKQTTFPKEFKLAIKEIQKGVENPLEVARQKLVNLVIKNGKLDEFLKGIA